MPHRAGGDVAVRIAITGGTGLVGRHLASRLVSLGHEVVSVSRGVHRGPAARDLAARPSVTIARASVTEVPSLARAFDGCDAVAHCAGINREIGTQSYHAVHVEGTANVRRAAEQVGVGHLAIVSFLRARPACGSPYHESKWEAEEIVRGAALAWTVVKPGLVYGPGDQFLGHLSRALRTVPVYVGMGHRRVRPLWVEDLVDVLVAAVVDRDLDGRTVPVVGPTELGLDDAVRMLAQVIDRRVWILRLPRLFHRLLAVAAEATMTEPLVARAQVRMLEEEIVEPVLAPDRLPSRLEPRTAFDHGAVRAGLPAVPERFGLDDLRVLGRRSR